jgi:hypothetical protein
MSDPASGAAAVVSTKPAMPPSVIEGIKLWGTFFNNLGVNMIIVGGAAPIAAGLIDPNRWNWDSMWVPFLYLAAGLSLHFTGQFVLKGLK